MEFNKIELEIIHAGISCAIDQHYNGCGLDIDVLYDLYERIEYHLAILDNIEFDRENGK